MKVTDERLSDKELGKWIEIMQGFMTGNNFDKFTCNGQILSALEELKSLRKIDVPGTIKYAGEAGAACEEMKHGIEQATIEIEKKAKRVVNKYSDDELSFSSGLYESITIIENHLSKYLDE